jgi:Tol biopolymer transport system component
MPQLGDAQVSIIAVQNADTADLDADETSSSFTYLTKEGTKNNAFPAASPDGKYVVFRSSRSGYKNLYIMDAVHGEEKYLRRLTEGPWGDTMPAWSPDNEWIAFASNRVHPTGNAFHINCT